MEDQPVPMSLEQTESMHSEVDQMVFVYLFVSNFQIHFKFELVIDSVIGMLQEEVEMEDIMEEPVMDIDTPDAKNPLAVVDYIQDLYSYYSKVEVHFDSIV